MLQGQSNAVLFWHGSDSGRGSYDTAFGHFHRPLLVLTGLAETQVNFVADRYGETAHSLAAATSTYQIPGSDDNWLNPDAPGARRADPASWGDGTHMRALRRYSQAQQGALPRDRPWLLIRMHSEHDSTLGEAEQSGLYDAANREFVRRWRAALGRPTPLLPVFFVPVPFAMNTQAGALGAIRAAWNGMAGEPAQNAHLALGSSLDAEDRGDGSHWSSAAADRVALRMAIRIARWLWENGYAANDLDWLPTLGPRIISAHRVAGQANRLDLRIGHDKGNDLVVPPRPDLKAFLVSDNGAARAVVAVQRQAPDRLRLDLDTALGGPAAQVLVDYGLWTSYAGPSTQITDNWHLLPKPALAQQAGVDRVPMILCRMAGPVIAVNER